MEFTADTDAGYLAQRLAWLQDQLVPQESPAEQPEATVPWPALQEGGVAYLPVGLW